MHKLTLSILFLICLVSATLQGQNIIFNHLTTDDGLSQFSVNSLYIDENGILWIGTREGLNRYNGEDIQTYKLEKNNPNSLFCNTILRIVGNLDGKIYLLCTDGIAEFNLVTQKFTTLLQGNIHSIYYNNGLYIGKKNEIYHYNEKTGNFDLYYQLAGAGVEICCMHMDKEALWMGTTTDGIYRLQLTDKQLTHPIEKGNITSIYQDSSGDLWIGSWKHGLFRIKPDGSMQNFRYDPQNPHSISSDFVRACCEDNLGNIWIGTFTGLNRYNKSTGLFQNHTADDVLADGLTHSSIWCIVKDKQGTLWLGTYFGGINYFNPEYEIYTRYNYSPDDAYNHIKQVDFAMQWPLTERLYGLFRYNYSLRGSKPLEVIGGLEYHHDCWIFRAVAQRYTTTSNEEETNFFLQLELSGLGSIGNNPLSELQRNIKGYQTRTSAPMTSAPYDYYE